MNAKEDSSDTVGSLGVVKSIPQDMVQLKHAESESNQTQADLNANIGTAEGHGSSSEFDSEALRRESANNSKIRVSQETTSGGHQENAMTNDTDMSAIPVSHEELKNTPADKREPTVESEREHVVDSLQTEDRFYIESQGAISTEHISVETNTAAENNIVVQEEELAGSIEEQGDTPTVVVATAGESGQYEIHMISSEFQNLTEGLPEGTQLVTEDGQLIHAVQEDEHGNMVVLANDALAEIHTVDEQTGETVITETGEAVTHELHDPTQHMEHDVVSEAVAEAQVSYVEEEMIEQPTEMVMLGEDAGYIVTEGESEELIVGEAPTVEVCAETEIGTGVETSAVYTDDNMLGKYVPDEGQVVVERIGYQPVQVPVIPHQREQEVHHEEYIEEEDEEISYHEDVISESNQTIPNYDEANEIRMLTEAANDSLRTMEEHYNPPKKRRPRKKKLDGEQGGAEGTKPKRRRRPPQPYFNELGEPTSGRTEQLLRGLENLNLPVATAGTAPMSPPAPKPEPAVIVPSSNEMNPALPQLPALQPPSKVRGPEIHIPYPSLRLPRPHAAVPSLSVPQMVPLQMVTPQMKSPNVSSPSMVSPSLVSPQMTSPRMISPGQHGPQLSPRTVSATQKKHPLLSTILSVTSPGGPGLRPNVSPPSGIVSPGNQMMRMPRNVTPFPFPPRPMTTEGQQRTVAPAVAPAVIPSRQGQMVGASPVTSPTLRPLQLPVHLQQQQQLRGIPQQSNPLNHTAAQPIPRLQPPQSVQLRPAGSAERMVVPVVPYQPFPIPTNNTISSTPISTGLQQIISNIASGRQQLPPARPVAAVPTESRAEDVPPQETQEKSTGISDRNNVESIVAGDHGKSSVEDQDTTESKPKIQELIKSELLAAAWESRQPHPPVSLPAQKLETNTLATTISRVEERIRQAASEAQKSGQEVSPVTKAQPPPYLSEAQKSAPEVSSATKAQPPPYSAAVQNPAVSRTELPVPGGNTTLQPHVAAQGPRLPPISTLQTKLPPSLIPTTVAIPSSTAALSMHITASMAGKHQPNLMSTVAHVAPQSTEDKEAGSVQLGQIPVPREALRSPVSSSGLSKDPMLSGPNVPLPATQQPTSQPSADAFRNAAHPLVPGRLPAPFPLAFAPGLPPVGLMMQPIPPLGFGRPPVMPPIRPPAEGFGSNHLPTPTSASLPSVSPGTAAPQSKSPTADKHKVLSSTLQSPPANQPNPLDAIMEVMKKEMSGVVKNEKMGTATASPRFPTPGPTMEMLMAIMQREVAAAQIQAQVAALHAAHAQAQVSQSAGSHKSTVVHSASQPLKGSQSNQLAIQAGAPVETPVRAALPPVSTVMSTAGLLKTGTEIKPAAQPPSQEQSRPQVPPNPTAQNQIVTHNSDVQLPAASMHIQQRFVNNKTADDTLADKYMKEWKPTGRFQCKFCYYSCVTQNFLFRHWVMNHCCMKPFLCAYCGLKSPTRDGITRHQTSKHKGHPRRVVIDATQEGTLIQNFKALFNLDVKEIHPEDIRMDSLEGVQFPEQLNARLDIQSAGATNGEPEIFPSMTEVNHLVKNEIVSPEKQPLGQLPPKTSNPALIEQMSPYFKDRFMATPVTETRVEDNGEKTPDYVRRHHKKTMIDSVIPTSNGDGVSGPLSKEQLHALAVAQAAEIDRSMILTQNSKSTESQKLPSIGEMRNILTTVGPSNASTRNTLPSIRDLIQMPRGQRLAVAGLGSARNPHTPQSVADFPQSAFSPSQLAAAESGTKSEDGLLTGALYAGTLPPSHTVSHDDRPVLPAGVIVPRLPPNKPEHLPSESEAHQAAAQLVNMANSRNVLPQRHVTPPTTSKVTPDQDQQVAAMVSNVAAAAEQQKAALSLEHEVAAQLEDFARRKAGQSGISPPAAMAPPQPSSFTSYNPQTSGSRQQKELTIDQQVALQLEEFRRRKKIIEAQEAMKPKKSPKAKSRRSSVSQNINAAFHDQRHGSNSVDEVVAQLHQLAQKRAEDQQAKTASHGPPYTTAVAISAQTMQAKSAVLPQSTIDEQRLLATQLEELAQRRAVAIQAAIRAQAQQSVTSPVIEREVATQLTQFADVQRSQSGNTVSNTAVAAQGESTAPTTAVSAQSQKDTMYHLYERAVVESYKSTESGDKSDSSGTQQEVHRTLPQDWCASNSTTGISGKESSSVSNVNQHEISVTREAVGNSSIVESSTSLAMAVSTGTINVAETTVVTSDKIGFTQTKSMPASSDRVNVAETAAVASDGMDFAQTKSLPVSSGSVSAAEATTVTSDTMAMPPSSGRVNVADTTAVTFDTISSTQTNLAETTVVTSDTIGSAQTKSMPASSGSVVEATAVTSGTIGFTQTRATWQHSESETSVQNIPHNEALVRQPEGEVKSRYQNSEKEFEHEKQAHTEANVNTSEGVAVSGSFQSSKHSTEVTAMKSTSDSTENQGHTVSEASKDDFETPSRTTVPLDMEVSREENDEPALNAADSSVPVAFAKETSSNTSADQTKPAASQSIQRAVEVSGSSPTQQENVCHDSEMSDVSDRASISPGLNVPTPETLQLTPEYNSQPNEN